MTSPLPPSSTFEEIKYQMKEKDKKQPMDSVPALPFLLGMSIGVPLYLGVLLPSSIILGIGEVLLHKISEKKKGKNVIDLKRGIPEKIIPFAERKYDLVLLGSTGFAGSLAVKYLLRTYGVDKSVKWAIAGRSEAKLEKLKRDIASEVKNDSILEVNTIIVDTSKIETLPSLVQNTRCVASTAGPFTLYGSSVVEYCAKNGTHYVDITGETDWTREMQLTWESTAQTTGAKLISCCGHDSIPWDLSTQLLRQKFQESFPNDNLARVECYHEVMGGISGGTLASIIVIIEDLISCGFNPKKLMEYDPYLKLPNGEKSTYRTVDKCLQTFEKASNSRYICGSKWGVFSPMALCNFDNIRRSEALQCTTKSKRRILEYKEAMLVPTFSTAFSIWFGLVSFMTALLNPLTRFFLKKFIIPKPGEGPSYQEMQDGYLIIYGYGMTKDKQKKIESTLYFPKDPGYWDTSRMLVESGLCLSLEEDKLIRGGGFFSAGYCLGNVLLNRLCNTGTMYSLSIPSMEANKKQL